MLKIDAVRTCRRWTSDGTADAEETGVKRLDVIAIVISKRRFVNFFLFQAGSELRKTRLY